MGKGLKVVPAYQISDGVWDRQESEEDAQTPDDKGAIEREATIEREVANLLHENPSMAKAYASGLIVTAAAMFQDESVCCSGTKCVCFASSSESVHQGRRCNLCGFQAHVACVKKITCASICLSCVALHELTFNGEEVLSMELKNRLIKSKPLFLRELKLCSNQELQLQMIKEYSRDRSKKESRDRSKKDNGNVDGK
jgi:hypothetical protein